MRKKTIYYSSYDQDVVTSSNQEYRLADNYEWENISKRDRFREWILYPLFTLFSYVYCPLTLHEKVIGREKLLDKSKGSYFIYANHTQPVGDAFTPTFVIRGRRIVVPIAAANLGIPVLGPLLRYLGGLPIPSDGNGLKKMTKALMNGVDKERVIVVYPEAHVWPYYTRIRPFDTASFTYPVQKNRPVYAMTSTYQKRKKGETPAITVYIDGPFYPEEGLSKKEQKIKLHQQVVEAMEMRSKESNYEFYEYTLQR